MEQQVMKFSNCLLLHGKDKSMLCNISIFLRRELKDDAILHVEDAKDDDDNVTAEDVQRLSTNFMTQGIPIKGQGGG